MRRTIALATCAVVLAALGCSSAQTAPTPQTAASSSAATRSSTPTATPSPTPSPTPTRTPTPSPTPTPIPQMLVSRDGTCPSTLPIMLLDSGVWVDARQHPDHLAQMHAQRCYRTVAALRADVPDAPPASAYPDASTVYCSMSDAEFPPQSLMSKVSRFLDLNQAVTRTSVASLPSVMIQLQDLRRGLDTLAVPWCFTYIRTALASALDEEIAAFMAVLANDDGGVSAHLSLAGRAANALTNEFNILLSIQRHQPVPPPTAMTVPTR